jgi:ribonucleotide reductase alpha subunit
MTYTYEEVKQATLKYFDGDDLAASTVISKYLLKNKDGEYLERDPDDMHHRLTKEFARIEAKYPNPLSEDEIYSYFKNFGKIIPQGSPMSVIGNPYQIQSSGSCFVIQSPYDSYGGILKTDQEQVQLMKRRAGVGFDISTIRPKGLSTSNAAGTTDGIAVFMERYSNTCREVAQGGRRGALLQSISIHHPDIRTFIHIKKDLKKVTGANISIRLTDKFMVAVEKNEKFELKWPVDSDHPKISNWIDAKPIWDEIIDSAWTCGEPGLLLWDTILRRGPADIYPQFRSSSTNPCVVGTTWIQTEQGPKQVLDLLNFDFNAIVNGKSYKAKAFWHTGSKEIVRLKTDKGYYLDLTKDHQLLCIKNGQEVWTEVGKLDVGSTISLSNHTDFSWEGEGNFEKGWLVGEVLGDGCHNPSKYKTFLCFWGDHRLYMKDQAVKYIKNLGDKIRFDFGCEKSEKSKTFCRVSSSSLKELVSRYLINDSGKKCLADLEKTSSDFYCGFLRGFFDADGSCSLDAKKSSLVKLSQSNLDTLTIVQRMLSRLGIISHIYKRREAGKCDFRDGYRSYQTKIQWELYISKDNILRFHKKIGFSDPAKASKLEEIVQSFTKGPYKEDFRAKITEIIPLGKHDVYDTCVDTVHEFDANGIRAHNCGEIPIGIYDSCRLLLINPLSFVQKPFMNDTFFDWDQFASASQMAQRLMDDLVDLELEQIDKILNKINSDTEPDDIKQVEIDLWEKVKKSCINGRRTGLGLTAVGDLVAYLNMKYGDDKSIAFVEELYKQLAVNSYISSCRMAGERGCFPAFDMSLEKEHLFLQQVWDASPEAYDLYQKYGRRNIANTTTSPAGSVSIAAQTSFGIGPVYNLSYKRKKKVNLGDDTKNVIVDQMGDKWQEYDVIHHGLTKWKQVTGKTNIEESPYWGATAYEINWVNSVKLQASAQKWVCHSLSNTINVPEDISKEEVSRIYFEAWKSGCKGITVYRNNSRDGILTIDKPKDQIKYQEAPRRPEILPCEIHHKTIRGSKWTILVGLLNDKPYEVFAGPSENIEIPEIFVKGNITKNPRKSMNSRYDLKFGENGSETIVKNIVKWFENDDYGTMSRLVSTSLRHGVPIQYLVEQLQKDPNDDIWSFNRVLARVLKTHIPEGIKRDSVCPECGEKGLVYQEGCLLCSNCGYSKCS